MLVLIFSASGWIACLFSLLRSYFLLVFLLVFWLGFDRVWLVAASCWCFWSFVVVERLCFCCCYFSCLL
jgi:hypothetical protein